MTTIPIAILGATGVVGQKAIALLQNHPKFKITEIVASEKRIGKTFQEVCLWRELFISLPQEIATMQFVSVNNLKSKMIISCLPSDRAAEIEPMLLNQEKIIFSNASYFRMKADVPLLIPEVNSNHLQLLKNQKTKGKIIANPNCSTVAITLSLVPLMELATIDHVSVVTMQSISGAGYPGVASLDILGNTIPHIADEANKIIEETKKILGEINKKANFSVTASVNRVPVAYGHSIVMHVAFKKDMTKEEVINKYKERNQKYSNLYVLHNELGRPQSIKDLQHNDMRIHLGHIEQGDKKNIISLVSLSHNLVRGAAGAVIANMESYLDFMEKENA